MKPNHAGQLTGAFGIDIGGSGIKGAPVDLIIGELSPDRVRSRTPRPPPPQPRRRRGRYAVREGWRAFRKLGEGRPFGRVRAWGASGLGSAWLPPDKNALLALQTAMKQADKQRKR